ncbi:MAG: glycosyltransferase [Bacteroidaceae bacterium]|nr:glycosyltransferase [Bacteroidaceae bacterium]
MSLSPVALFVYNRADNTRKTIDHLLANTLAKETDLYVFSDGGKDEKSWRQVNEVRTLLHQVKSEVEKTAALHCMTLIERPENIYLERNITEGIAQVFQTHDRIIVLEDDICTSPYYLQYMNQAFDLYKDIPTVMHVAGFTNLDIETPAFYFTPHMSGWGWGTWRDRWQQHFVHYETREEALQGMTATDQKAIQYGGVFPCLRSLDKRPIPWDICWEIAIYKAGGLCLTPGHTLVRNIGLQNGTHFRAFSLLQHYEFDRAPLQAPLPLTCIEKPQKDLAIENLFAEAITDWGIRYTPLGKFVRWIYKRILRK